MHEAFILIASFTAPVDIGTDPWSMLYMFPIMAVIALVYKATKMRVLLVRRYLIESLLLFLTISAFMITAIIVLNILDRLVTS